MFNGVIRIYKCLGMYHQAMLFQTLSLVLAWLALASSREINRAAPTISNSLVNLGKMEISFYLSGRDPPSKFERPAPLFLPKSDPTFEEPCPCSSLHNVKDSFVSNPSGALNKLLMNNDLFSSNDPVTSTMCCESHEHVEEGTVIFEFPKNQKQSKLPSIRSNSLPYMPFLFDSIIPNILPNLPPVKSKAIEIFLFPKKKDAGKFDFPKLQLKKKEVNPKDVIQIVGDKDLKKTFISIPPPPSKANEQKEVMKKEEPNNVENSGNKINTV